MPGHISLFGLLILTPITSGLLLDLPALFLDVERGWGISTSTSSGSAGFSAFTSEAGLSVRRSLNAACRTMPSAVQLANSISATSSGFTQLIPLAYLGAFGPVNGLLSVLSGLILGRTRFTFSAL